MNALLTFQYALNWISSETDLTMKGEMTHSVEALLLGCFCHLAIISGRTKALMWIQFICMYICICIHT